jgi:hypothetical protein
MPIENKKYKIDYSKSPSGGVCDLGYHFVKGHNRICHSGKATWVNEHIRKNKARQSKDYQPYLSENLYYVFQKARKRNYPKIGKICGFLEYEEVDLLIHFWLDYWREQGLPFPDNLTPKHVKALIAHESSFNPKAKAKTSTAAGLMQITKTARMSMSGKEIKGYAEVQKGSIQIDSHDLFNPLINVASGTRWLSYKFSKIPKNAEKNVFNTMKNYNQWNKDGEAYARNVLELYEKKCP